LADPASPIAKDAGAHVVEMARVVVRRPRLSRWLERASLAAGVGTFLASLAHVAAGTPALPRSWTVLTLCTLLLAPAALRSIGTCTGHVRAVGDRLLAGSGWRRLDLRRKGVQAGAIVPGDDGHRVELDLADGRLVTVDTRDRSSAERLLEAAGVSAAQRRTRIALFDGDEARGRVLALLLMLSALIALSATTEGAYVLVVLGTLLAALVAHALRTAWRKPMEVSVGTDGIEFSWGGERRFYGLDEIHDIRSTDEGFAIILQDGERVSFVTSAHSPERLRALALRVRTAVQARARLPRTEASLAVLDRAGRSLPQWRRALDRLGKRAGDYRSISLSRDEMTVVVSDPGAKPQHRVAAALALAATGDPDALQRVRVAADTGVSPRMRIALEGIAEESPDDEAIEQALAEGEARAPGA
jgi:hypothetical protein